MPWILTDVKWRCRIQAWPCCCPGREQDHRLFLDVAVDFEMFDWNLNVFYSGPGWTDVYCESRFLFHYFWTLIELFLPIALSCLRIFGSERQGYLRLRLDFIFYREIWSNFQALLLTYSRICFPRAFSQHTSCFRLAPFGTFLLKAFFIAVGQVWHAGRCNCVCSCITVIATLCITFSHEESVYFIWPQMSPIIFMHVHVRTDICANTYRRRTFWYHRFGAAASIHASL